MNLPQLRRDLAAAKAALRQAKDETDTAKAIATLDVTGKNDDERKRAAAAALLSNHTYKLAVQYLRDCESEIDRIEAEVAICEDQIRADELRVREKLADALLGQREDNAASDGYSGATAAFASRRNGRTDVPEPVEYQPRPTHYMRRDEETTDWYAG